MSKESWTSSSVWSGGTPVIAGGEFTSRTATWKERVAEAPFPSVARTVMVWLAGPCSSAGAQVKLPMAWVELAVSVVMLAPVGGLERPNLMEPSGPSGSVAVTLKVTGDSSSTCWSGTDWITGRLLGGGGGGRTVTVTESELVAPC